MLEPFHGILKILGAAAGLTVLTVVVAVVMNVAAWRD